MKPRIDGPASSTHDIITAFRDPAFTSGPVAVTASQPWDERLAPAPPLGTGWHCVMCTPPLPDGLLRLYGADRLLAQVGLGNEAGNWVRLPPAPILSLGLVVTAWPDTRVISNLAVIPKTGLQRAAYLARRSVEFLMRVTAGSPVRPGLREHVRSEPPAGSGFGGLSKTPLVVQHLTDVTVVSASPITLDRRTLPFVRSLLAAEPDVLGVYGDKAGGRPMSAVPEWDDIFAAHGGYDDAIAVLRGLVDGPFTSVSALLRDLSNREGTSAVRRVPLPVGRGDPPARQLDWPPKPPTMTRWPSVSVVIPTKDRLDFLKTCLRGLAEDTDYPEFEVIVVHNDVPNRLFNAVIEEFVTTLKISVIHDPSSFNFSSLVNQGVEKAKGDLVVLLNDDVRPLHADWLSRMVARASDPLIGAVGARLIYPSGDVQHAGLFLGESMTPRHLGRHLPPAEACLSPRIAMPGSRVAVTAACLAIRRSTYRAVSGFDADAFPVTMNDVDFCLRVQDAGYRNLYCGDVILQHDESQTRGNDDATVEQIERRTTELATFAKRWGGRVIDPYASPAFDPACETGRTLSVVFIPDRADHGAGSLHTAIG
jgi:GT2 family glycosyltransferase